MTTTVRSPRAYFGFRLGDDRCIARWDEIVDYLHELAGASDRIVVQELGKSTEGQPFLLVVISAPDNLARLEELRQINLGLADPRGLDETAAERLIAGGRVVVCQSMSLHGSEIGGTQMAPELAYSLLHGDDEDTQRILANVILLMIPCFNPDGQVMVTDWYRRWVGTEHEGAALPWLYHKYAGHDNNRDAVMQNLVESAYAGRILFRDWAPHVYQDHHHMGGDSARFYVAPYSEPIRPHADPLVWREIGWYGGHLSYLLEEAGVKGVISGARFAAWGHLGFHRLACLHNTAGLLTESASAQLATPRYVHPEQLRGLDPQGHPAHAAQTNYPNPWLGGWWRLRDIVEQQKIAAWAVLDLAARYRRRVLTNAYRKAANQIARGRRAGPYAWAISPHQHDPLTAVKLVRLLQDQGVEVLRAGEEFVAGDQTIDAGSYLVPLAQPKMGVIRSLLEPTIYPDNHWTRRPDGSPMVYDVSTDTVAEYMGVRITPVVSRPRAELVRLTAPATHPGCPVTPGRRYYAVDPRTNDAYQILNRLWDAGVQVGRLDGPFAVGCGERLPAGAFVFEGGQAVATLCARLGDELGVSFCSLRQLPATCRKAGLERRRIGIYQRYWGGNMAEGWIRLLLDRFGFAYAVLHDADFADADRLRDKVDTLILAADDPRLIVGPDHPRGQGVAWPDMPPDFRSGLGEAGVAAIAGFVRGGGRLVALGHAGELASEALGLRVRDVVRGLAPREFYGKGVTLWGEVTNGQPLGYGMPARALLMYVNGPVYEVQGSFGADDYEAVVRYADRDLVGSGWLVGGERVVGRPAMLRVRVGGGEVVLYSFAPGFRGQTHGTFKLLFNTLV